MKVYTSDDIAIAGVIKYPYIEKQIVHGHEMLVYIAGIRAENWFGYKGHLDRMKDPNRAKE